MNREILFRGKCVSDSKYAGEWVTGGYVAPDADCKKRNEGLIVEYFGGNTTITYHVDPDTVGQFAGLVDKKGVKIFEGDIVTMMRKPEKRRHYELVRHVVTCNNVCDWVFKSLSNDVLGLVMANHSDFDSYKFEVIGNIYDNPELLSTK